jgi:hypothetical protein
MLWQLPPPASGANVFTGLNGSRTGSTTDTGKSSIVQPIVGDVIFTNERPEIMIRPGMKWIDFQKISVHRIKLKRSKLESGL